MKRTGSLLLCLSLTTLAAACGDDDAQADAAPPVETLVPEPAGAPQGVADGRLSCLGANDPAPPTGAAVELTGYVRTYADPTAATEPPAAQMEAFSATGTSLGTAFADPSKDGRITLTVPINEDGFTGYVRVTDDAYLPYKFQTNRAVTVVEANGWTWLVTTDDLDALETAYDITQQDGNGMLAGAVHDCDGFGVGNAVVTVNAATDAALYTSDFAADPAGTYTDVSGRFVVPNVTPGNVTIKAFGRTASGGALELLSSIQVAVAADEVTAVALQPR